MGTAQHMFKMTVDPGTTDLDIRVVVEARGGGDQAEALGAANLQVACANGHVLVDKISGTVLTQLKKESTVKGRMWSWSGERQGTGQLVEWLQIQGPINCHATIMVSNMYTTELVGAVSYKWAGVNPCPAFPATVPGCTPCSEVSCGPDQTGSCDGSSMFTCVDTSTKVAPTPAPAVPSWSPTPASPVPSPAASPTAKTVVASGFKPAPSVGSIPQTGPAVSAPVAIGFILVVVGLVFLALCLTKISFAARRRRSGGKTKGVTTRGLDVLGDELGETFYRTAINSSNPYGVERTTHAESFDSRGDDSELAPRSVSFASNASEVEAARMAFGQAGPYGYKAVPGASPAPSLPDSGRSLRGYAGGPPAPPPGLAPHKPSVELERTRTSTRVPLHHRESHFTGGCCIS